MIKIKMFFIGTLKEKYLISMQDEYLKRLSKYATISIFESKEISFDSNKLTKEGIKNILDKEDKIILEKINKDDILILLDLRGKEFSSEEFASKFNDFISSLRGDIVFVIGGPLGLSDELRNRSNLRVKLSSLTFTHQFCRVILLEQIYRAFKIINKENYHY